MALLPSILNQRNCEFVILKTSIGKKCRVFKVEVEKALQRVVVNFSATQSKSASIFRFPVGYHAEITAYLVYNGLHFLKIVGVVL